MPDILNGIPDAEGWYAGCHMWSKLDSDAMNWKVKMILEQQTVEIYQIMFKRVSAETHFYKHNIVHANIRT